MALNCKSEKSITIPCGEFNMAGISNIYYINKSDITAFNKNSIGTITGITVNDPSAYVYEIEFQEDSAFATQPFQKTNGNTFYTANIEMRIPYQDQEIINILSTLDFSKFVIICKFNTGKYFLYGEYRHLSKTGGDLSSGTAVGDASGVLVVLTGGGPYPSPEVDYAAFSALLDPLL